MIKRKEDDKMISIRKRGKVYQYCFEAAKSLRFDDPSVAIEWIDNIDINTLTEKDRKGLFLTDL